jgi:hypothetical protein
MVATPANSGKVTDYFMKMVYKSEADCDEKVLYCVLRKSRVV